MANLTDYAKNLVARAICARAPTLPTQVFLGLGTGFGPGGITGEPTGAGYARQRVTFTGSGPQSNAAALNFVFTGAVGTLSAVGLFDAPSGGNALTASALAAPITVAGAGTVTVAVADLDVEAA